MWLGLGTPLTGRQGLVSRQKLSYEMEGLELSLGGAGGKVGCTPREDVGELCSREWSRGAVAGTLGKGDWYPRCSKGCS